MSLSSHCRKLLSICATAVIVFSGSAAQAQNPAPRLKQLKIGCYTYSGSAIWESDAIRRWYAERYAFIIGSGDNPQTPGHVLEMRNINPSMKALLYQLFVLPAEDTNKVKAWCAMKGYNFNDLILRVKNTETVRVRAADIGSGGFARYVTTQPGGVLLGPGFTDAQTRFMWDYRNPKVGEYLGEMWRDAVKDMGYDGAFVDEEAIIGHTNNYPAGIYPPVAPYADITPNYWSQGSPYTSLTRPWGQNFDLEDAGSTHSYVDVRDSLRRARKGWMGVAGNIMKNAGLMTAPNFAAVPVNAHNNWTYEGIMSANLYGSYIMGEYSYFSPSADGVENNCNTAVQACYSIKDSAINMFLGWIRMGQFEYESGISFDRSKMNGLGMWLDCFFPGKAQYYFSPSVKNGQVDVLMNRWVSNTAADDTTTMWANAWGKYFGVPQTTRDTSMKGTDPSGQTYTMHRIQLMNPNNQSQIQTVVLGRYTRGRNYDLNQTAVPVNLGGQYYELLPDGRYGARVTSATVANAQWKVFVADTTLANNGVSGSGGGGNNADVTVPAATSNLSAISGTAIGDVNLSWTAAGDDGTVGTVAGYEIMSRDSALGPITNANYSTSRLINKTFPIRPGGSAQLLTVGASDGLIPGKSYYFAIKAFDEAGNYSPLSNVPKAMATQMTDPNVCVGTTGNLNCDNSVDISDLVLLINYLFIDFQRPPCFAEANIDGMGGVEPDVSDLTALINYLFVGGSLAPCDQQAAQL